VTGGGGGTNVAVEPGDSGGGKGWKLIEPLGLVGALNENRSAAPCSSRPNRAATSHRDRLGDGVLSPSEYSSSLNGFRIIFFFLGRARWGGGGARKTLVSRPGASRKKSGCSNLNSPSWHFRKP